MWESFVVPAVTRVAPADRLALRDRLAILEHAGFRRLLVGRSVSVLGDGLYAVAAMWLVFELTGSTAYTGLAGFLTQIPGVFAVLVGPVVDRSRLERLLTLSEVLQGIVVLVVPIAWATGNLTVGVVLVTMPVLSAVGLFAGPAQTAAVPRLVPGESLVRANAATRSVGKSVDALARGVGGALVALFGPIGAYAVDAATFAVAALTFAGLSIPGPTDAETEPTSAEISPTNAEPTSTDDESGTEPSELASDGAAFDREEYFTDLREGIDTIVGTVVGRMVVAVLFANFMFGVAFAVLPAFADEIGGAGTYGLLLAGFTVGGVVGSLFSSAVESSPLGRTTVVGMSTAGALFAAGIWLASPLLTVGLITISRVPVGMYNVSVMATLQSGIPDERLGRVAAAIGSASSLVSPVGVLLGGLLGEVVGASTVLLLSATGPVLMATYWLVVPSLRRFGPPTEVEPGSFV